MFSYVNRCKDRLPHETIQNARNIIYDLGLITSEQWFAPVYGLYSLHLSVIGTSIYSNGKGSTPEFALASAYGELLERIQNLAFYRVSRYSDYYVSNFPFKVAKDERITKKLCELAGQEKYFRMVLNKNRFDECIDAWEYVYGNTPIVNTRFKNLMDPTDEIDVPELVFSVYYGSNGMAGGNTYAEAFVQALSEIFERYAVRRIISEKLTPPDITNRIIERFPDIGEAIREIQSQSEDIIIQIKDISLGQGLPVFAAVYIDKKNNEYFVNFGCHPNVAVAVERCLTELYQGQDRVKVNNATCINEIIEDPSRTMNSIFSTGEGAYPVLFFGKNVSYAELDIKDMIFKSNAEMFTYYMNIITDLGFKLYYQDAGFLGFPAVSILIPGMSEAIFDPSNVDIIRNSEQHIHFLRNYQSIETLKESDLISLAQYLEGSQYYPSTSINEILRVPIDQHNNSHFDDITIDLFLTMIYIRLFKYPQAKKHLDAFIKYMRASNADSCSIQYNLIISSILRCRIDKMDNDHIVDCLSEFFPTDEVRTCIEDINPETIFDGLPICTCPNCSVCEYGRICHFLHDNAVANRLLEIKQHYNEETSMLMRIMQ